MSYQGIEPTVLVLKPLTKQNNTKQKSYKAIETSRFDFYDLHKENIFLNNIDVSILDRRGEKYNDKCFHIVMICTRKEKTMLLLNNSVFREYNQI